MTAPKDIQEAKEKGLNRLENTEVYKRLLRIELKNGSKKQVGRPKKITTEVLRKLYEAFIVGSSDEEACFWANIGVRTLGDFQEANPDFPPLKEQWKLNPTLKARNTIYKNLDNPLNAQWYLERKKKNEFAQRTEVTGNEGTDLKGLIKVFYDTDK